MGEGEPHEGIAKPGTVAAVPENVGQPFLRARKPGELPRDLAQLVNRLVHQAVLLEDLGLRDPAGDEFFVRGPERHRGGLDA